MRTKDLCGQQGAEATSRAEEGTEEREVSCIEERRGSLLIVQYDLGRDIIIIIIYDSWNGGILLLNTVTRSKETVRFGHLAHDKSSASTVTRSKELVMGQRTKSDGQRVPALRYKSQYVAFVPSVLSRHPLVLAAGWG